MEGTLVVSRASEPKTLFRDTAVVFAMPILSKASWWTSGMLIFAFFQTIGVLLRQNQCVQELYLGPLSCMEGL